MAWLSYSHKGVAKRLSVNTQPAGAVAGVALTTQPVVALLDGASLPASTPNVSVSVVKHSGVTGTLTGTSPKLTASNGRATFTDLAMSAAESGVSLDFSASGLTGVTSSAFTVAASGSLQAIEVFSATQDIHTRDPRAAMARCRLADDWQGWGTRRTVHGVSPDTINWMNGPGGGLNQVDTNGWGMTINCGAGIAQTAAQGWPIHITPARGVRLGAAVGPYGQPAVANTGQIPQSTPSPNPGTSAPDYVDPEVGIQFDHNIPGSCTDIWFEIATRLSDDWVFGEGQKWFNWEASVGSGGILQGAWGTGVGNGPPFGNVLKFVSQRPDIIYEPNLVGSTPWNSIRLLAGHSYRFLIHQKLNTPGNSDGILEMWQDDGGTSQPASFPSTHTLKVMNYTNANYGALGGETWGAMWLQQYDHNGTGYAGSRDIAAPIFWEGGVGVTAATFEPCPTQATWV